MASGADHGQWRGPVHPFNWSFLVSVLQTSLAVSADWCVYQPYCGRVSYLRSTFAYQCTYWLEILVVLNKLSLFSHRLSIIPQVPTELFWNGRGCQGICQNYIVFHLTLEVTRSFSLKCNLKVQRAFFPLFSSFGNSFRDCMQLSWLTC